MPETRFRIGTRFLDFWVNLKSEEIRSKQTIKIFLGWTVSFIFLLRPIDLPFSLTLLFYAAHVYFWFRIIAELHQKIRPPNELLIVLFLLVYLVEMVLLRSIYSTHTFLVPTIKTPALHFSLHQILLLALLVLLFSLILTENSKGKKGVLILYAGLGWIGMHTSDPFYLFILQVILFVLLLRRTSWLEELTKLECWLYWLVALYMFRRFSALSPFVGVQGTQVEQAEIWYGLPRFLFLLFKIYLLAIAVKIPVVLVYNFASLSRKLKFASLFQSTFPQLIQLFMLLSIFYFLVAGWQAEKVRQTILGQMQQISVAPSDSIDVYELQNLDSNSILAVEGYQSVQLSRKLPAQGILSLTKEPTILNLISEKVDYFLFLRRDQSDEESVYLVKLDPTFLQRITKNTSILAGSMLLAYPYTPPLWESYLYKLSFWKEAHEFRIFPFGFRPQGSAKALSASFEPKEGRSGEWTARVSNFLLSPYRVTFGRVIAPLLKENMQPDGFYAFEIVLVPDFSLLSRTLISYLGLLVVIYFLVNVLVIRRMSRFGTEINRMIVQKFNQLRRGIREISTGNLDYKVRVEGEDEFVELAARFNQMGDKLKESMAEARDKERLRQELTIARNVQLSLLPRTLPEIPGYQIAATLETANEVGGDFYDVLPLDKDRYLFTIGDVSGKSTSAAFYMAQCISLIRFSPQFTDDPREIVLRLNNYFADPLVDRKIFVTAIVGILNLRTSTVSLVRAGHPLPILIPRKSPQIQAVESNGLGIGLERSGNLFEKNLENKSVKLKLGDALVFYTDGVVEAARGGSGQNDQENEVQFYGEERLMDLLKELRGQTASELVEALTEDIKSFYAGNTPVDDYTLLIVQK